MAENTHQIARDVRFDYRDHPAVFLCAAAGIGVLLGAVLAPASSRSAAYQNRGSAPREFSRRNPKVEQLIATWGHISDALIGVATAKVVDAIAEQLPGFREQYERRIARRSYPDGFDVGAEEPSARQESARSRI